MYHYVRNMEKSYPKGIKGLDSKEFISQIKHFQKNSNIISIDDFYNKDYNPRKKNYVLTFDDGYLDHYENVFPILLKHKIKGAFFTSVDPILNNKLLEVNKVHLILAESEEKKIFERLSYHFNKLEDRIDLSDIIKTIDIKSRYDTKLTIIIKRLLQTKLPKKLRTKICNLLLEEFINKSESELAKKWYINLSHISEMIKEGMHFGSHGKSHKWFSSIDVEEQNFEIEESKKFLKNLYNDNFILSICYPYGDYNKETIKLIKKHNFNLGFTTIPRSFKKNDDLLLIPRFDTNDYN